MSVRSLLTLRIQPGQRDSATQAYIRRRVLEECAQAIPGFLGGELLLKPDDPEHIWVSALWEDEASYLQWLKSPVRAAQGVDLGASIAQAPSSALFQVAHAWSSVPKDS